jgi:hypothetical protein
MINLGRSQIEALIDISCTAPAIEATCVANSKDKAKLPPASHITLACASADCRLFRS